MAASHNRVDCENTEGLRNWLLELRPGGIEWWSRRDAAPVAPVEQDPAELRRERLRRLVREQATGLSERGRELLAHVIDFHRRAKKRAAQSSLGGRSTRTFSKAPF
ncbi:hypothetical protein EYB45_08855 [Erythrobacteraceae bacterium CFH 75059]|uniref:hypothetical protein n=1 Tax=Qipengyuania thermophila TaxID=2509361 RepID=UPI001022424B|nr:hypothetical protein [Qipengyuania thermophila]TCD04336.1 hypothetical protein EYB45_08855 [Erythrobacteraceae bacterium CFH 75059]